MFTVQSSEFINRPVEDVFAFISDKENLPQWASDILSVKLTSDGPKAVGTTFLIVAQAPGQKVETQYTYTTYEKNKTFGGRGVAEPMMVFNDYYQFEPRDQGTHVTLRLEISPRGLFRLLQPVMRLMIGKTTHAELAKAKKVLESRA
jgi:uncharacterized membrane protein